MYSCAVSNEDYMRINTQEVPLTTQAPFTIDTFDNGESVVNRSDNREYVRKCGEIHWTDFARRQLSPLTSKYRLSVTGSYKNSQYFYPFQAEMPFEITLETTNSVNQDNNIQLIWNGYNSYKFDAQKKNENTYTINNVEKIVTNSGDSKKENAENFIIATIGQSANLVFNYDNSFVIIKNSEYNYQFDKLPLDKPINGQPQENAVESISLPSNYFTFESNSYKVNNYLQSLIQSDHIKLFVFFSSRSRMTVMVHGNDKYLMTMNGDNIFPNIARVDMLGTDTSALGDQTQKSAESTIKNFLLETKSFSIQNNKITFYKDSDANSITFTASGGKYVGQYSTFSNGLIDNDPNTWLLLDPSNSNSAENYLKVKITQNNGNLIINYEDSIISTIDYNVNTNAIYTVNTQLRNSNTYKNAIESAISNGLGSTRFVDISSTHIYLKDNNSNKVLTFIKKKNNVALSSGETLVCYVQNSKNSKCDANSNNCIAEDTVNGDYVFEVKSYKNWGSYKTLYTDTEHPVILTFDEYSKGEAKVTIKILDTKSYKMQWQEKDGWLKFVGSLDSTPASQPLPMNAAQLTNTQIALQELIQSAFQISIDKNAGTVTFFKDSSQTAATFKKIANTNDLVPVQHESVEYASDKLKPISFITKNGNIMMVDPATYTQNHIVTSLYSADKPSYPILLEVIVHNPLSTKLALHGVTSQFFDIMHDKNGNVKSVVHNELNYSTVILDKDDEQAELKILDKIKTAHKLFYKDNLLSIENVDGGFSTKAVSIMLNYKPGTSYKKKNETVKFYSGYNYPIYVIIAEDSNSNGIIIAFGLNKFVYYYQSKLDSVDVESLKLISYTGEKVPAADADSENALQYCISNAKSIKKTVNLTTFVSDSATTELELTKLPVSPQEPFLPIFERIDSVGKTDIFYYNFRPGVDRRYQGVKTVMVNTYMKDNVLTTLFDQGEFPVTVTILKAPQEGFLEVTLNSVTASVYNYNYQVADGIILNRKKIRQYQNYREDKFLVTEKKLIDIFDNLYKISYELDGQVQFIANFGKDKISFI